MILSHSCFTGIMNISPPLHMTPSLWISETQGEIFQDLIGLLLMYFFPSLKIRIAVFKSLFGCTY